MPTPQIRISKTKELAAMLKALKEQFMLLSEADIFKLALSHFYRTQEEERIKKWEESLPYMELSDEEQESLTKGIQDLEAGRGRIMTVEEIMKKITE